MTNQSNTEITTKRGLVYAICCYLMWGLLPLYWKLLQNVSSFEILAHRMLWSFVFMAIMCRFIKRINIRPLLRDRKMVLTLGLAGLIVSCNWGLYIYAVNAGHVVQTSLGYFINPLVSIILGVFFFQEKLSPAQKIASILAAIGVLYFTFDYGSFSLIALGLALSFGFYGAIKKKGGYEATAALAIETMLMSIPALVFIAITFRGASQAFLATPMTLPSAETSILLIIAGVVTAIPLLLFAKAANSVPLSTLGFIQYLSPTCTLLLGVFLYHEQFTHAHAICFAFIWAGLALVSIEAIRRPEREMSSETLENAAAE